MHKQAKRDAVKLLKKTKMTCSQISLLQILIKCMGKIQNSGYLYLKENYSRLCLYGKI